MHSGGPQSLGWLYSIPDTDTLLKSTNKKGFYTGLGASKDDGLIQRYACLGLDHKCGFEKLKPDFLGYFYQEISLYTHFSDSLRL